MKKKTGSDRKSIIEIENKQQGKLEPLSFYTLAFFRAHQIIKILTSMFNLHCHEKWLSNYAQNVN